MSTIPAGYEVLSSKPLPRLDGHLYDLVHTETGARHVHLSVPDRNSYFFACYRTLRDDSTGAPHIMEHCVSGGSRRFPPGAGGDMYSRSLVTDLNGTTHADFTNYYFATRNRGDFMNWMEYVTDVSLYPRMEEDTFLRQRGHLEFNDIEDPASGLKFVGVIFNEQKAVFGSPSRHALGALSRALFPGHPYSHDAGGNHRNVPDLTYEDIMEFNKGHYHPANAMYISRGSVPLDEMLAKVEEIIGSDYPKQPPVEVPAIPQLDKPVVLEAPFPVGSEEKDDAGQLLLGWVTLPSADSYARLQMQILGDSLMEGPTAPVRRALEDSGLVGGLVHGDVAPYLRTMFVIYLTGVEPSNAGRIEELVRETLSEVAGKGLDAGLLDNNITRLELRRREQRGALNAFLEAVMPPIVYGGDPYPALELDSDLARLAEERSQGRPLEDLITSQLLENPHRARVTMVPDPGYEQRIREEEDRWLADVEAKLTDEERAKIVEDGKRLSVRPEEPFEKRGLTPKDGLTELSVPEGERVQASGVPIDLYKAATGGISYLGLRVDLSGLADELLDYIGLFSSVVSRKAQGGADLIGVTNHLRVDPSGERTIHWLELSARALDRDQAQLPEMVQDLLGNLELDPKVIGQLISESDSRLEQGVMGEAQIHLRRLAGGALRRSAQIDDRTRGLSQLAFLKQLDGKSAAENLGAIRDQLLARNRLAIYVVGSDPAALLSPVEDALTGVPEGQSLPTGDSDLLKDGDRPHRARIAQLPVAFTCEAHAIPGLTHPDSPAIAVLGHLLWIGHLNPAVRKIGAYGIDVETLPERGLFWISSRRDPMPADTYQAMTEGIRRFREGSWDASKAEDGMLGALRVTDPVDSPATAARRAWIGDFTGHTVGAWNDFRKRILEVTDSDLQRVAESHLSDGARATLAGPQLRDSELFDEVHDT